MREGRRPRIIVDGKEQEAPVPEHVSSAVKCIEDANQQIKNINKRALAPEEFGMIPLSALVSSWHIILHSGVSSDSLEANGFCAAASQWMG